MLFKELWNGKGVFFLAFSLFTLLVPLSPFVVSTLFLLWSSSFSLFLINLRKVGVVKPTEMREGRGHSIRMPGGGGREGGRVCTVLCPPP